MLQTQRVVVHRLIEANFSLDGGQLQFSSILSGNGLGTLVSVHVVRGCAIRMNRCNESLGDVIKFSYPVFSFSIDSLYSSRSSNQFSISLYRTLSVPTAWWTENYYKKKVHLKSFQNPFLLCPGSAQLAIRTWSVIGTTITKFHFRFLLHRINSCFCTLVPFFYQLLLIEHDQNSLKLKNLMKF